MVYPISRRRKGLGFCWFFGLRSALTVDGLWLELERSGAVAERTWWETEKSEKIHNFPICVVLPSAFLILTLTLLVKSQLKPKLVALKHKMLQRASCTLTIDQLPPRTLVLGLEQRLNAALLFLK